MIVGNPFPVVEHPVIFYRDQNHKIQKERNQKGYLGKPIKTGYQSHFTLGIYFIFILLFYFYFFNLYFILSILIFIPK